MKHDLFPLRKIERKRFEPDTAKQAEATENQKQLSEKQLQTLRDFSQTTTQALQDSSTIHNKSLQKSVKEGIQEYDKFTNCKNQVLPNLVDSNTVDSSIVKTVSNLLNDKNKSQFSLEPEESNSSLFTINHTIPQLVQIKDSTMTFKIGNTYNLNDQDLQNFITNTQLDKKPQNVDVIYTFLNYMKYIINIPGDKKSKRYHFNKDLIIQYQYRESQLGSGFNQYIFLPTDPDELVDQLRLLYLEKVGRNDNPTLSEKIIAIADKL